MFRLIVSIFTSFFKIGLFTLGGGLAIVPLIQQEMVANKWLETSQFLDILGIAQATPGPIGLNTATFVGYHVASLQGANVFQSLSVALIASFAVMLPSMISVHFVGSWFEKNKDRPIVICVFKLLRPLVAGFVTAAGIGLVLECFGTENVYSFFNCKVDFVSLVIVIATLLFTLSNKISPLWGLVLGGLLGVIF
jgi:chromate transporter